MPDIDFGSCCVVGGGGCVCLTLIVLMIMSATVIPVGMVGVVTFLGHAYPDPLYPGMTFINPFASVTKMSTQTQIFHFADYVPTQEGVNVYLEASCLVHLEGDKAVNVFEKVGEEYSPVILVPQLESVVREVTSDHNASALYSASARQNMTTSLRNELQNMTILNVRANERNTPVSLKDFGLVIESTPINKLSLPATITDAIEKKMTLQQEAEQMEYVLEKEVQEARRKVIEAEGIANYQNIIVSNTTDGMMRFNAIQATETLAASCGAKVVLLGENGLPMVHSHRPPGDNTTKLGVAPNPDDLMKMDNTLDSIDASGTGLHSPDHHVAAAVAAGPGSAHAMLPDEHAMARDELSRQEQQVQLERMRRQHMQRGGGH